VQKARLGQPRFLQQEKRRGKMKKRKESNLFKPSDLFPDWM